MSGAAGKRPVIIVAVCAAVAVTVLLVGVSCGGGNRPGARDWQDSFAGAAQGSSLTAGDLEGSSGCTATGRQLLVAGSCAFLIKPFGGAFGLGPPTKRATLVPQQAIDIEVVVEGTRIGQHVDPGKTVPLTFGKSGGRLGVTCLSAGGCAVQLLEAGG